MLKLASKWAWNNEMKFGVNKCASLVVQGEASKFLNNNDPTFFIFQDKSYLKKRIAIYYFGVSFLNDLELKTYNTENE